MDQSALQKKEQDRSRLQMATTRPTAEGWSTVEHWDGAVEYGACVGTADRRPTVLSGVAVWSICGCKSPVRAKYAPLDAALEVSAQKDHRAHAEGEAPYTI